MSFSLPTTLAMEFRFDYNPEQKIRVIVGEGEIKEGDAQRLTIAMQDAGRDQYGNISLYLNSPGGSVTAAIEVANVIIENEFSVLVPSASTCASACIIPYLSGRFHQLLGDGLLGLHSCYYVRSDGKPQPLPLCNKEIAQFVFRQGTSVGAILDYMNETPPDEIVYIGSDVACSYGLCGPPGFDSTLAIPSFRCFGSLNAVERAICNDRRLARNEASLAKLYNDTLNRVHVSTRPAITQSQRNWIKRRDMCLGDNIHRCILESINQQSHVLLAFTD